MAENTSQRCPYELPSAEKESILDPLIEKHEAALLMLLGFAGIAVMVALAYNAMRRYVFKDYHNLDVVFDAGGRVSLSLTAVTVTSQLFWPADFLQSPTIASKVGISGSLWYTLAIVICLLLFPMLCIKLKTHAPGAKTYPQIAYARFGKPAHIMFCAVAIFTNLVVLLAGILAGKSVFEVLVKDVTTEIILLILAVLYGSYCLIGGLGTTFYISYLNTALIFIVTSIFIIEVRFVSDANVSDITDTENIYSALSCLLGPEGNHDRSLLTFRSESGVIYGVFFLLVAFSGIYCDQANWQSRVSAKPNQGVMGFLFAAFLWFGVPTSFSFVMSLTYKSMSFGNGTNLLSDLQIDEGKITPFVIQSILGEKGCYLLLVLMSMTLMSTGSGEVMSLSSIFVYDIIKTYILPFRSNMCPTVCVLCGKTKVSRDHATVLCDCPTAKDCKECSEDIIKAREALKRNFVANYQCNIHGRYRHYEDMLLRYKTWCMVTIVICIVPYGLLIQESGMNLNWAILTPTVIITPFIMPLFYTISWAGATSNGIVAGGGLGLVAGICGTLVKASLLEGGLSKFYTNTVDDFSLLTGILCGFGVSVITPLTFCVYSRVYKMIGSKRLERGRREYGDIQMTNPSELEEEDKVEDLSQNDYEWLKTMAIDNPLNPYRELYKEELDAMMVGKHVTSRDMETIYKKSEYVSYVSAAFSLLLFLVVVPGVAMIHETLDVSQLDAWISVSQYWCFACTFIVIIVPPIEEGVQIWRQIKKNRMSNGS